MSRFGSIVYLSLFLIATTSCSTLQDKDDEAPGWHTPWTVVAEKKDIRYTFVAPRGTFWFPPQLQTDEALDKRLVKWSTPTLEWHYGSGMPLIQWQAQFMDKGENPTIVSTRGKVPDEPTLSTSLWIIGEEIDTAAFAITGHLTRYYKYEKRS